MPINKWIMMASIFPKAWIIYKYLHLLIKKTFVFIVNIRVTVGWTVRCANVNKNKFLVY